MQSIKLSQEEAHAHQEQEQRSRLRRQTFLDSLWFNETNSRVNEIAASHRDTFQWIFDDDQDRPWDCFTTWLKGDEPVYWIHGKPGSGKSTLMKFLANATPTQDYLAEWCPNDEVLVVTYYFWLAGSHIQRSLKGFLCSIIRQTVIDDQRLLDTLLAEQPKLLVKRNINDWDPKELRTLLIHLTSSRTRPVCYFLDGLDEFDQGDDIESVLSLIEEISSTRRTKFCVSSRPEHYISTRLSRHPQLRLQDLTAADMKILIYDELSNARRKCKPAQIDDKRFNKIVKTMSRKADGVFLWVHYAINSLVKGMRNQDDFKDLLNRIEDLPGGMYELYLQMWKRQNEDQQRYRDEAAMYFSYCDLETISLFEMVIALDPGLQRMYLNSVMPLGDVDVAKQCELLETRLFIRSAGLLETVFDDWPPDKHYSIQYRRLAWEDSDSPIQRMSLEGHLLRHHKMRIKFIHRTARDFIFDSHEGRSLFGQPRESLSLRWQNFIKARMAVMIQGLEPFMCDWVAYTMRYIAKNCKENEVELVATLRHLCERLSMPGIPLHNIGYHSFWETDDDLSAITGFEGPAAVTGCEQYIQHLLQGHQYYFSSYYLGVLIIAFTLRFRWTHSKVGVELERYSRWQSITSWLISSGADLRAKYVIGNYIENVVSNVLWVMDWAQQYLKDSGQVAKQAVGIIEQLLMGLACSDSDCLMILTQEDDWRPSRSWWYDTSDCFVVIRSSARGLCWRAAELFDLPVSSEIWST